MRTAKQRAALRKAQLASARKRKSRGNGKRKAKSFAKGFRNGVRVKKFKPPTKNHSRAYKIGTKVGTATWLAGAVGAAYAIGTIKSKATRKVARTIGRQAAQRNSRRRR